MLRQEQEVKVRRPSRDLEHKLQSECVRWFRMEYPDFGLLLFAVPNGTNKSKAARIRFKEEGLLSGVADLLLLVARGGYHGLCIEMKTEKGKQSDEQKAWEKAVTEEGYLYVVCHSREEFENVIYNYLTMPE